MEKIFFAVSFVIFSALSVFMFVYGLATDNVGHVIVGGLALCGAWIAVLPLLGDIFDFLEEHK